jgi:vancomycin resistance protein YoaR
MSAITSQTTGVFDIFKRIFWILFAGTALFILAVILTLVGFQVWYSGRIYPGISVSGIDLSGLRPAAAAEKLSQAFTYSQDGKILFKDGNLVWQATPAQLGFLLDADAGAQAAYGIGRQGSWAEILSEQVDTWFYGVDLPPTVIYDQRFSQQYLLSLAKQIDKPVIEAKVSLDGVAVVVNSGQVGRTLDVPKTLELISVQLRTLHDATIPLVIHETPPLIMNASQQAEMAKSILSQPLTLTMPDGQDDVGPWTLDVQTLANMLTIQTVKTSDGSTIQVGLNPDLLRGYLASLAPAIATTPQNARYTFNDDTKQLEVIQHAVLGRTLNLDASEDAVTQKLAQGEHNIQLVIDTNSPPASDTTTGADLGITQLVGSATTYFYGSDAARVQNIKAASSRFMGLLVAPGETFSMAEALGDISLDNGYAEALIILGDQTIKGVGGGVCQVSTTLFRVVFFSGYPVVERHPHAYRVGYYEQKSNGSSDPKMAGLDATVFVPLVDFKFKNDTPYWLLMETYVNGYSLTWKFYSTSDGRSVSWDTTGPQNTVDPPPPLYTENPDLPKGTIKQVDWAAQGADITITRTVSKNGEVYFQDKFSTHYEAWQAKYQYGPGTENIPTAEPTTTNTPQ